MIEFFYKKKNIYTFTPFSQTPKCCPSGKLTLDACGCCQVCAKAQNEICGGPWYTSGQCASGLDCLKECGN